MNDSWAATNRIDSKKLHDEVFQIGLKIYIRIIVVGNAVVVILV